jgi:hypothetical protein
MALLELPTQAVVVVVVEVTVQMAAQAAPVWSSSKCQTPLPQPSQVV